MEWFNKWLDTLYNTFIVADRYKTLIQGFEKTVKKALDELCEESYITFARGRYGGTFVTDIPQNVKEAYKWLAISTDYMSN